MSVLTHSRGNLVVKKFFSWLAPIFILWHKLGVMWHYNNLRPPCKSTPPRLGGRRGMAGWGNLKILQIHSSQMKEKLDRLVNKENQQHVQEVSSMQVGRYFYVYLLSLLLLVFLQHWSCFNCQSQQWCLFSGDARGDPDQESPLTARSGTHVSGNHHSFLWMIFIGTIFLEPKQIILRQFPGGGPAVKTSSITDQAMRRKAVI